MIGPLTNLQTSPVITLWPILNGLEPIRHVTHDSDTTGGNSSAWEMPKLKTVPWFRYDTSLRRTRQCAELR